MEKETQNLVARTVERAELPYILFPDDLALRFRLDPDEARVAIRQGLLGPWFLVRGEPAVLRDHLKEHLRIRMLQQEDRHKEVLPQMEGTGLRLLDQDEAEQEE